MIRIGLGLAVVACAGCAGTAATEPPVGQPEPVEADVEAEPRERVDLLPRLASWQRERPRPLAGLRYLKGALHVHTVHSGDSTTPVEAVIRHYDRAGFDFVVITDHNRITDPVTAEVPGSDLLVFPGVELTNNPPRCDPPPPAENGRCRIHVNGLLLGDFSSHSPDERPIRHDWRERNSIARADLYDAAFRFTRERGGLIMVNHPTWHWGTDGALLAELGRRGARFVEIANVAFAAWNAGSDVHPGTEAIWDAALSAGRVMWGVASDDAHHYRQSVIDRRARAGDRVYPAGGGFVMVRARPSRRSIRAALDRGDFYSSTGVLLDRAEVEGDELVVEVRGDRDHRIEVIGDGGEVLERSAARAVRFPLARTLTYARVVVTADDGARAWTQPAFRTRPSRGRSSPSPARSRSR